MSNPTIYLVTYHAFNHEKPGTKPIDRRFTDTDKNYIFYLIDSKIPESLKGRQVLFEKKIDPLFFRAGKEVAEWSFLLSEVKNSFCNYPFFMISSRFYEKNNWLTYDLNYEWDRIFNFLEHYGWGYLPSYDRPLRWIDYQKQWNRSQKWDECFIPFTKKGLQLSQQLFGIEIPCRYRYVSDLFCNFIGFKSREHLLRYVEFYKPLFDYFYGPDFSLKTKLEDYVPYNQHRSLKRFTLLLESFSHLFFYKNALPFFAMHYDGYYEIDESKKRMQRIHPFQYSLPTKFQRAVDWQWRKLKTESMLSVIKRRLAAGIK